MTFDEVCAILRAGKFTTYVDLAPQAERRHPLDLTLSFRETDDALAVVREPETLEALRVHQASIAFMVTWSDIRLCPSPDSHRQSYRYVVFYEGRSIYVCDQCADVRLVAKEQSATSPPNTIADFRQSPES
jgi:hypothetical protein